MSRAIRFWLDDRLVEEVGLPPTTTLLRYLRDHAGQPGTKEGCAEGDCGACTVAILEEKEGGGGRFRAVNSCLLFLPMLQGKRVYTVGALRERGAAMADSASGYHPVQQAMVDTRGSQCGYCTPGIVMSLFEACYRSDMQGEGAGWTIDDQLCGNLCRCTGYRPIREAAEAVAGLQPADRFRAEANQYRPDDPALDYVASHPLHGEQHYAQPTSEEALWNAMEAWPDARLVAGGTDLGLEVTKFHRVLTHIIGLEGLPALRTVEADEAGWTVGSGVTLTRLLEAVDGALPALEKMLRVFGSRQIRSRATIGGNLATCSPIGDLGPVLVALGAQATVASRNGKRTMPVSDFLTGYRQPDLQPGELLWSVRIPKPRGYAMSYKVSKRREMDISTVSAGMHVVLADGGDGPPVVHDIVISYGGLTARPAARAAFTERALRGKPWTMATVQAATEMVKNDTTPIDDLRGTADYRRLLAKNLLLGFFLDSQRPADAALEDHPTATVTAGGHA